MNSYRHLDSSVLLAHETGALELADTVSRHEVLHQDLFDIIRSQWDVNLHPYRHRPNVQSFVAVEAENIKDTELVSFYAGLDIQPGNHAWTYITEADSPTLFPTQISRKFAEVTEADGLVVSGAIGLHLSAYEERFPILDSERFQEFGFKSYVDACGFAGALVVGSIIDKETRSRTDIESTYIVDDALLVEECVETFTHGITKKYQRISALKNVLSPLGTPVPYTPVCFIECDDED